MTQKEEAALVLENCAVFIKSAFRYMRDEHVAEFKKAYSFAIKELRKPPVVDTAMEEYVAKSVLKKELNIANLHSGIVSALQNIVDETPAADVQEVKHGTYINTNHGGIHGDYIYRCSCCGNEREAYIEEENYCPHCGAKMDGEGEELLF